MQFGKIKPRPTELASAVAQLSFAGVPRTQRTHEVKRKLCELGRTLGYTVYPDASLDTPKRQWMYDLVWWNGCPNKNAIKLAVECEWSGKISSLVYDFRKLLIIKSALKLFIYQAGEQDDGNRRDAFEKCLLNFSQHVCRENYVFCECHADGSWQCYLFRPKKVGQDGRVREVRFRMLKNTAYAPVRAKAATA